MRALLFRGCWPHSQGSTSADKWTSADNVPANLPTIKEKKPQVHLKTSGCRQTTVMRQRAKPAVYGYAKELPEPEIQSALDLAAFYGLLCRVKGSQPSVGRAERSALTSPVPVRSGL